MKNIRPLSDFILVKKISPKEQTEGGVYIPQANRELSNKATVISTGPGKVNSNGDLNEMTIKKNWVVLFNIHAARDLGDDYLLLREADIFAVEN